MNENIDLTQIRARLENAQGPAFWRSLDELAETAEFQEFMQKEFPQHAAPLESSLDRRDFLKLLGASLALAGLTACARPLPEHEKVVPYVQQPEEIIPGRPLFFASAITDSGYAEGVLVESHQGRPTKIEGNPDHPASLGATAAQTQAAVLSLYDPDRSNGIRQGGATRSWQDLATAVQAALADAPNGAGVRFLTGNVTSPTLAVQMSALLGALPEARWHVHAPERAALYAGTGLAFGQPLMPRFDFSAADVVVSLDADFTADYPGRLRYARDFSDRRRIRSAADGMNRFYAFEASPTPTGSLADHRVPLAPAGIAALAAALAARLGAGPAAEVPAGVDPTLFEALVADLEANRGRSLVVAGQYQPPVVQALAHAINDALGNTGTTVTYLTPPEPTAALEAGTLEELVAEMENGEVRALFIIGQNPVYGAPGTVDFAAALARVPFSVHLGHYLDETAALTTWHVPQAHFLEGWSDARSFDGVTTITQPLIAPLYNGRSEHELLALLQGDAEATTYDLIREQWQGRVEGSFDSFWREALYRGVVPGSASTAASVAVQPFDATLPDLGTGLVAQLRPDPTVGDGRWANNGWLQELPKPFTKLTWDNAALVAPATAEELGLQTGDVVELSAGARTVSAPVFILPGQAPGAVTLHLGYGRQSTGRVGTGLGFAAAPLLAAADTWQVPVELRKTGGRYPLVTTQSHHALEGTGDARYIIRRGTLAEFQAEPEQPTFVHPVPHPESDLYRDWEYNGYAWGMVIDMNVCTGCSACVVACQAENNIPIVGKEQVAVGREMHWLRIDNYYSGSVDDPEFYHQPMLCQHCEQAPCEPVCPVGATVHDHEGLNVMVYNRCVGTRYCSNNCPYKVRRFNYLQYAELSETATELSMAYNPDVTVRSRGVMEKCTYCTQRISQARITANNEGRTIRDGEVMTACQAACPTRAIVFGDINDPESVVAQTKQSPLNYSLLEELNTQPRTSYLARVKNVSPQAAGGETGAI